jgi:hypothetical protein
MQSLFHGKKSHTWILLLLLAGSQSTHDAMFKIAVNKTKLQLNTNQYASRNAPSKRFHCQKKLGKGSEYQNSITNLFFLIQFRLRSEEPFCVYLWNCQRRTVFYCKIGHRTIRSSRPLLHILQKKISKTIVLKTLYRIFR